jgi:hypothetical protein
MWRVVVCILLIIHQVVLGQTLLGQLNLHSWNDSISFPDGLSSRINKNKPHQIATTLMPETTTVTENASKVATTETSLIMQETSISSESDTQLPIEVCLYQHKYINFVFK